MGWLADETVSTLNYANMAKLILNKPLKNEVTVGGSFDCGLISAFTVPHSHLLLWLA
jgi:hypothetical protein